MPQLTHASPSNKPVESARPSRRYWRMVWAQFARNRLATVCLFLVIALFLVALLAPLLANNKPLLMRLEGQLSSPMLREFFAPSETQERILECIFNFILIYLLGCVILLLPVWLFMGRCHKALRQVAVSALAALLFVALLLPFLLVKPKLDTTDYRARKAEAASVAGDFVYLPLVVYGPFEQFTAHQPPDAKHLMGTDKVGRDVLSRIIHGARVSLSVGFLAVGVSVAIGIIIGAISAYFGGAMDLVLQRIVEVVICFPTFLLILTVMALLEKRSIFNVMLVIGLTGWTGIARLVRGQMLTQRKLDYVTAAQALGGGPARIIFLHLVPNSIAPVLVAATFGVAGAILTESGLSFLGFGVSPPTASWGELINQALEWPIGYWWLTIWPGFMIFLTVTLYNLVGEGLRDALDPRLKV